MISIRLARPDDGGSIAAIYRPAVVDEATSFEIEPPDAEEMTRRIAKLTGRTPWLVVERDGDLIGYAYAGPHRERAAYQWSVEVSAYVDAAAHRSGTARMLYTSLFALLVLQGYRSAYAGITLPNAASEGFHRALGFTPVGTFHGIGYKFGRWHDVMWLERQLAPRTVDPTPPRSLAEIIALPEASGALSAGLALLRPTTKL
jgi:L-amino acid N-acyltransferase YncA